MSDFESCPKVFLQTGDCFLAVRPTLVTTVLGSCVAVTMWAPERCIGAICHAFLPERASFPRCDADPQLCRFVDVALDRMFASMQKLKIAPERLVIKAFGGATGLLGPSCATCYDIGGRNVRAVKNWMKSHDLTFAKTQLGGSQGRKLHFLTHTGEVWVKLLNRSGREV